MKVLGWFIAVMGMWTCVGCNITPTPTPSPVPTTIPSPTVMVPNPTGVMSTQITNRKAPANVPACSDAQDLEKPIEFAWAGIENVVQSTPASNWVYYRCNLAPSMLAAFYRRWMPEQYRWVQTYWEERTNATLGVYFYSTGTSSEPSRWLYLWFLPDESTKETSYLVSAWWEAPKSC